MVWALLLSSFTAPVFFRKVLAKQESNNDNTSGDGGDDLHTSDQVRKRGQEAAGGSVVTTAIR